MTAKVGIVLKGYPRLSETFIAKEILALEQRGLDIRLISLRHPTDKKHHPVHDSIRATVNYLPEYLYQEPMRLWRAWRRARRLPGYRKAKALWWADLKRDFSTNRGRRFGQALVLAAELEPEVDHLHAHFLHTPASVARYAAHMRGLTWSCSAHAKDIWTSPDWEKREKLADLEWLACCSRAAYDDLAALAPQANKPDGPVYLHYHGLDLAQFSVPALPVSDHDGRIAAKTVQILSVGRAVPKKGYPFVLEALARIPAELHWHFTHIGGGPDLKRLREQADRLGLTARITWRGACDQKDVIAAYQQADLFILASRIHDDGDRDGLPNVLLEAASQRLAILATEVSAIPEFIEDGRHGVLVPSEDAAALADALTALIQAPAKRHELALAAEKRLREEFDQETCIDGLAVHFGLSDTSVTTAAE